MMAPLSQKHARMPLSLLLAAALSPMAAVDTDAGTSLPARFESDLIYVAPTFVDGRSLLFYTDTGGGYFIDGDVVTEQGIATLPGSEALRRELGPDAMLARLPAQQEGHSIPLGISADGAIPILADAKRGQLPGMRPIDGMLGAPWFAGRVWTWDFKAAQFRVESANWSAASAMRRVPLGFKRAQDGSAGLAYPRIDVRIDGKALPLLFDTGAMTVLAPEALAALNDGAPAQRATSMISDTIFQAWRKAHPEWRVIEAAQLGSGSAMIEVPEVEIAGWRVGPVWFTHRPDRNFHDFMSRMTDVRIEGAIGNNAFREFRMTVDYPNAAAYFVCTGRCEDIAKAGITQPEIALPEIAPPEITPPPAP